MPTPIDTAGNAAQILAKEGGWPMPSADAQGAFPFSLKGGLDFRLLSPDGSRVILEADLGACPDINTAEGSERMRYLAEACAGSITSRHAVFAIADGRMQLHTFLPAKQPAAIIEETEAFLRDLSWWKRVLERQLQPDCSPFSISTLFSGFPASPSDPSHGTEDTSKSPFFIDANLFRL